MLRQVLSALAVFVLLGCGPIMIEREGHRVFNPSYARFLEVRRDEWQLTEQVLDTLALPADAIVADVGAGGGYFTERLSRRLPSGRVYATDAQDEMIERLNERVRRRDLQNVTVLRVGFDDPGLPEACCDLVFFSSVYKEIDGRVAYMRRLKGALRSGGRVAILEFRPGGRGAGPPEDVRLTANAIEAELSQAGLELVQSHSFLPRQSFQLFALLADPGASPSAGATDPR